MQEPEVSLRIAIKYIQDSETSEDVCVSIDGAHIKTKDKVHFDLTGFLQENGYTMLNGSSECWQGRYQSPHHSQQIIISSTPGVGDVIITLKDGRTLYIESKKFKSGNSAEYPAMREAIGQLMTNCPDCDNIVPVVAVPYSTKSEELARKWSQNKRVQNAGIHFILVSDDGHIGYI